MIDQDGNTQAAQQTQRRCALCGRSDPALRLTRHHLVPRTRVRKAKRKRNDNARELADTAERRGVADLCKACHGMIHAVLTEKQLAEHYNSIERLLEHEEVACFVAWVAKQKPDRRINVRWTQQRRDDKALAKQRRG